MARLTRVPKAAATVVSTSSEPRTDSNYDGGELPLREATAALHRAIETNNTSSVVSAWHRVIPSWTLRWQKAFQRNEGAAGHDNDGRDDDHHPWTMTMIKKTTTLVSDHSLCGRSRACLKEPSSLPCAPSGSSVSHLVISLLACPTISVPTLPHKRGRPVYHGL